MKRFLVATIALMLVSSVTELGAQVKVRFMPQWCPQAQFAGYYIAWERGFFTEEGLDVEIVPTSPYARYNVSEYLRNGEVDIITLPLAQAIRNHSADFDIVNVLQTIQKSGFCIISKNPIKDFKDLEGQKVISWSRGFAESAVIAMHEQRVNIQWIPSLAGMALFISGAADATMAYSYSELVRLKFAVGGIPDENILYFRDKGYNYPEDGVYVKRSYYKNNADTVKKFVKAVKRGWEYASAHPEEAAKCTVRQAALAGIRESPYIQEEMVKEMLNLMTNPSSGRIDFAAPSADVVKQIQKKLNEAGLVTDNVEYEKLIMQ